MQVKILGLVMARKGSKGLPGKNFRQINGKPLIHYPLKLLTSIEQVESTYFSTDCINMWKYAKDNFPCIKNSAIRSKALSGDHVSSIDVINFVLDSVNQDNSFTHVLLLQPTNPQVKRATVLSVISKGEESKADAIITAHRVTSVTPSWMFSADNDENFVQRWLDQETNRARRQSHPSYFERNGAAYLFKLVNGLVNADPYFGLTEFVEIDRDQGIGIDNLSQFEIVKNFMRDEYE